MFCKFTFFCNFNLSILTLKLKRMNVVITGASRGIGFAVVKALAEGGASKIIGVARNYKQLCVLRDWCLAHGKCEFIPIAYDLQQVASSEPQLMGVIKQHFKHIDILINNAGTIVNKPFENTSAEEINRMFTVNYLAPVLIIRNLLPLLKLGKAHVINITSMGGFQGSKKFTGLSHYSASKAALASITECLAEELGSQNIVFNALALGSVQTEMLSEAFPDYKAPVTPDQMGAFIANFAFTAKQFFNGKIIPVSLAIP